MIQKKIKTGGFTLIETLVAVSILLVAIVGPMEIASKGLFSAFYAQDEITAFYLAQEGVEYVRNARDTNYLIAIQEDPQRNWLQDMEQCTDYYLDSQSSPGCKLDATYIVGGWLFTDGATPCDGVCEPLRYDDETFGIFTNIYFDSPTGEQTKFTRILKILVDGPDVIQADSATIEVTVTWTTGGLFTSTRSFTLREKIFNWNK